MSIHSDRTSTYLMALLLVATAVGATSPVRAGDLQTAPRHRPTTEITGAIDPSASALARGASLDPALNHALAARMRFFEARAAMERGFPLTDTASKVRVATLDASMRGLLDELMAIKRSEQSAPAASAEEARRLADEWYQAGLKIVAPPESGVTELPLPMLVSRKAVAVAAALDLLVEEASAHAQAPKRLELKALPKVSRKTAPASQPQPINQNQASLRLLRESLPLFLPFPVQAIILSRRSDAESEKASK